MRLDRPDLVMLAGQSRTTAAPTDDGVVTALQNGPCRSPRRSRPPGPRQRVPRDPPENNQDGGEPGGTLRVGLLFRRIAGWRSWTGLVGGRGDAGRRGAELWRWSRPTLSVQPGRTGARGSLWRRVGSRWPAEVTFNGHRSSAIGCHFASKRGRRPAAGRFQPPATAPARHGGRRRRGGPRDFCSELAGRRSIRADSSC